LPKLLLDSVNFSDGDIVEITTEKNAIIIKKPVVPKQRQTLESYLERYYGRPLAEILQESGETEEEFDWGKPAGEEIW